MPIIITDDDAARLLSIPEAIEAMRVAFRDLAEGKAVNPPRLRYSTDTADPKRRYFANIHAGAVQTYQIACVRAGSHFMLMDGNSGQRRTLDNPDPVNWSIIILYDLANGEPLAFMHETHLSGFRVGATTGLAVAECARPDAEVLGLFGTGNQAFPNCRAICAVRPIRRVKVLQPERCAPRGFQGADGGREGRGRFGGRSARGRARRPHRVLRHQCGGAGAQGRMAGARPDGGDHRQFRRDRDAQRSRRGHLRARRATSSSTTGRASSPTGRSSFCTRSRRASSSASRCTNWATSSPARSRCGRAPDRILYYKNNTGLAIQFAACGAILYRKLSLKGTNRTIPRDWFASQKYSIPPAG